MFIIQDGRKEFYQWDLDRKLIVSDGSIKEVHFCNKTDSCSLIRETYIVDGVCLVDVPNILLQSDWRINVYAYGDNYTKYSTCFKVNTRTKPEDYVHTDEELKTWEELESRVEALEQGGSSASKYEQPDWGKGEGEIIEKRYSQWYGDVGMEGIYLTQEEYNNVIAFYYYIGMDEYQQVPMEDYSTYYADMGFLQCDGAYVELSTIGEVIYKIPSEYLEKDNSSSGGITVCSIRGYIEEDMGEVEEFSHTPSEVYDMIINNQPVIFFVYINDFMGCSETHQQMPHYIGVDNSVCIGQWFFGNVEENYWQYTNTGYSLRRGGNTE